MKTVTKKQAIVQSLESMNYKEMENVLGYIKRQLYNEQNEEYLKFKSEALVEIQEALNKGQDLKTAV